MTGRGKGGTVSISEWDPMRDDFNDTCTEDDSEGVRLDHSKLYITNIPSGLAQDGLTDLFEKFGRLENSFLSRDPTRRFAIIKYETPGEARVAMMKLNRTEPLGLAINFAHAKQAKTSASNINRQSRSDRQIDAQDRSQTERTNRSARDDASSVSSKGRPRMVEDQINDDEIDEQTEGSEDVDFNNRNLHYNLETMKLKQLKLKEMQLECQQRILIMEQAEKSAMRNATGNVCKRRILPNGRIVIQNGAECQEDPGYPAGAGDSHNIPRLQRCARCVACGGAAAAFCARCGVTPYCGSRCQRRDWAERHRAVCHNLARFTPADAEEDVAVINDEPVVPPPAPATVRQPRSPQAPKPRSDTASDRANKKLIPPGQNTSTYQSLAKQAPSGPQETRNQRQGNTTRQGTQEKGKQGQAWRMKRQVNAGLNNRQENVGDNGGKNLQETGGDNAERKRQENAGISSRDDEDKNQSANRRFGLKSSVEERAIAQRQPLRRPEMQPKTSEPLPKPAQVETAVPAVPANAEAGIKLDVRDAIPRKPLVPNSYVAEKLPVGATFLATVEATASDCASQQKGYVCLTLHEDFGEMYGQLCEDFVEKCQADPEVYTPSIGETFAYFCKEDGGWYRARCLAPTRLAFLDSPRVLSLSNEHCRRLPPAYSALPEFTALIKTGKLEIGGNLRCSVVGKTPQGFKVTMEDSDSGLAIGEGEVMRYLPQVEYPAPDPTPVAAIQPSQPAVTQPAQPAVTQPAVTQPAGSQPAVSQPAVSQPILLTEVPRPSVVHNSNVVLVDVTSLERACVRPCDVKAITEFDSAHNDTMKYGMNAKPIQGPPAKGQIVIAKFSDGAHYRALVKRTNVAKNKYLIEYVEFGNLETVPIERLYPCPDNLQLSVKPAQSSIIKLSDRQPSKLTLAAMEYVEILKDNADELILVIPGGNKTAASGSTCILLNAHNSESVSRKIEEMCTPEWMRLMERGETVLGMPCRMFSEIQYIPVPTSRPFTLTVTYCDIDTLANGIINGYETGSPLVDFVYGDLTDQIQEYCASALCREPYLPKLEELCITKLERINKWVRSVLVELPDGPGSKMARVCLIDYGDIINVPVANIRKMLPEFIDQYPALANHLEIKGFPATVTKYQLERGLRLLGISTTGCGSLAVDRCHKLEEEIYEIESSQLIEALSE